MLVVGLATGVGLRQFARARTVQLFGRLVAHVDTPDSVVALTFDDGPVPALTDSLIAVLRGRGVRATFFVTGRELAAAPAAGRALVAAGHELGNHTYSHRRMVLTWPAAVRREVEQTDALIRAAGARGPIYFRPPYGVKLVALPLYLWRTGRTTLMWDVEPDSYPEVAVDPGRIVAHVLARVRPGSVVLLHPWYRTRATSLAAVPLLIDSLRARGYQVTTVRSLLAGTASARRPADVALHLSGVRGRGSAAAALPGGVPPRALTARK
jgi:peptidoglycan/xylan/chitin deacetylase (PgdA/CDA1 family)